MKTSGRLLRVLVIILSAVSYTHAQESARTQSPPQHRMELVYVFEAGSTQFVFVVGNVGFKSVASLKSFLCSLPPGSTLEWAPGCVRVGGEPLLSSEQEMEDFRAFCAEREIKFVLVPSG